MSNTPLAEAVLCWTPDTSDFFIGRLGDPYNDSGPHACTAGAVNAGWGDASPQRQLRLLFAEVMSIMARDRVPFDAVHNGLLVIPEYRRILAPDVAASDAEQGT